jgi:hypothetical protein
VVTAREFFIVVESIEGDNMSWRRVRRVWVTVWNVALLGLVVSSQLGDYELYNLSSRKPARGVLDILGPTILIVLLCLGLIFEWLDQTWPALCFNVGFWGVLGLGVLGGQLWRVMTNPERYHAEAALTVGIVGVPCTIVAVADFFLYWATRRNRDTLSAAPASQ